MTILRSFSQKLFSKVYNIKTMHIEISSHKMVKRDVWTNELKKTIQRGMVVCLLINISLLFFFERCSSNKYITVIDRASFKHKWAM